MKTMLIAFNMPLCDYGNEMLTDITHLEHVGSRNEDTVIIRDKSDENDFLP